MYTPEQFADEMRRNREERARAEQELAVVEAAAKAQDGDSETAISAACRKLYNTAVGMSLAERRECLRLLDARIEVKASGEARFAGTLPLYDPKPQGGGDLSSISLRPSVAA